MKNTANVDKNNNSKSSNAGGGVVSLNETLKGQTGSKKVEGSVDMDFNEDDAGEAKKQKKKAKKWRNRSKKELIWQKIQCKPKNPK